MNQFESKTVARGNYQRGICVKCGRESFVRLETVDGDTDLCNQHLTAAVTVMARKFAQEVVMQRVQTIAKAVTLKFSVGKSEAAELAELLQ